MTSSNDDPNGAYDVVAISWTNSGDNVDTDGLNVIAGCRRCPPGSAPCVQNGALANSGPPTCLLIVQFPTLAGAMAWKNLVAAEFDLIYWLPNGQCC